MDTGKPAARYVDATAMSRPDFALALMGAMDGSIMVYHRGDLMLARARSRQVRDLAEEAMDLYRQGWACLVQRRIRGHDNNFEYLAVARREIDRTPGGR